MKNEEKAGEINKAIKALKKIFMSLFFISLIYGFAEAGVGDSTMTFLKIEPSARVMGMGGSLVAIADDSQSVNSNVAGLSEIKGTEISFNHLAYFADINYESLIFGQQIGNKESIGLSLSYLNYGQIGRSGEDSLGNYDANASIGTYGAYSLMGEVIYAKEILSGLNIGAGIKVMNESIDSDGAIGFAADLGLIYRANEINKGLSIGASLQNAGLKINGSNLPMLVKAGLGQAIEMGDLTGKIGVEGDYLFDSNKIKGNIGAEAWYANTIGIRGGYRIGYDVDTFGVGVGFKGTFSGMGYKLDYAFAPGGDLGSTHRISAGVVIEK